MQSIKYVTLFLNNTSQVRSSRYSVNVQILAFISCLQTLLMPNISKCKQILIFCCESNTLCGLSPFFFSFFVYGKIFACLIQKPANLLSFNPGWTYIGVFCNVETRQINKRHFFTYINYGFTVKIKVFVRDMKKEVTQKYF